MTQHATRGCGLSFFLALLVFITGEFCFASERATAESPGLPQQSATPPKLSDLVRDIIIEASKEPHENLKHWNKTATRFDGLKFRGLKISKRKKTVRHGFCRKYSASLLKPESTFRIRIEPYELAEKEEGVTAYAVDASLKARCEGTFAQYTYGVKGINGTLISDADIDVRLILSIRPETDFSWDHPLPELKINAKVRDVDFKLKDVDVRRVGVLQGKFIEVVGDGLEPAFDELLQSQESRTKKRLQKKLDELQGAD